MAVRLAQYCKELLSNWFCRCSNNIANALVKYPRVSMKLILISHRASTFITQKTREGAKCKHCHPKSIEKVPLPPKFSFHMRQHLLHWGSSLTDWLIETGDWRFCMFDSSRTTPLVFYRVGIFVWSVWSVLSPRSVWSFCVICKFSKLSAFCSTSLDGF